MPDLILGIDLAGTIVRLVVVDDAGTVVARSEVPEGKRGGAWLGEAAGRIIAATRGNVTRVGLAVPVAARMPDDLADTLRDVIPGVRSVVSVAAGSATAIAEAWCGVARGLRHVMTFSVDDHVQAGVVIDGEAWAGAHGAAASVAWLAVNPVEREDYRRYGSLEAEVSCAGIVRRFVWRIKSGDESGLADRVNGDFSKITAEDILQASRTGDGVSISVVRDTARYVGMAVANMATLVDPEMIVLGGIIATQGDMLDAIRTECRRRLNPQHVPFVRIELSRLGQESAAIGAARSAASARV